MRRHILQLFNQEIQSLQLTIKTCELSTTKEGLKERIVKLKRDLERAENYKAKFLKLFLCNQ